MHHMQLHKSHKVSAAHLEKISVHHSAAALEVVFETLPCGFKAEVADIQLPANHSNVPVLGPLG